MRRGKAEEHKKSENQEDREDDEIEEETKGKVDRNVEVR
jgi:hypothetical protein